MQKQIMIRKKDGMLCTQTTSPTVGGQTRESKGKKWHQECAQASKEKWPLSASQVKCKILP